MRGIQNSWGIPRAQLQNYMGSMTVIVALQTTTAFTAAFTVPEVLNQDMGTPILIRHIPFHVFIISNVIAMFLSVICVICFPLMVVTNKLESVMMQGFALTLLLLSFVATILAFMAGLYATICPVKPLMAITALVLCSLPMPFLPRCVLTNVLLRFKYPKVRFVKKMFSWPADSSNTQEQRKEYQHRNQCGLTHDDKLLARVMPESIYPTGQYAESIRNNGSHSFATATVGVEANIDQIKDLSGEELSEFDASVKELEEYPSLQETDYVHEKSAQHDILNDAQTDVQQELRMRLCSIFDKVLVVDNVTVAMKVVKMLTHEYRHHVHACDTEVSKIDVKQETPVDHGKIICFSIYSGKEVDFGNGKTCVWVDVLDGGGKDILAKFAPFFEDSSIKKVWHNYSFDCHVVENYGIKLSGFFADTMHMARLWDSSRRTDGGCSLEALASNPDLMFENKMFQEEDLMGKISMKTIFGRRKTKKDGSPGKTVSLPSVEELQREERLPWICYSSLDSMGTLKLYESLKSKLSKMPWIMNGKCRGNMLNFYESYWRPFGKILVQMETEGMLVDRAYLSEVEKVAISQRKVAADRFRNWASKYCPDAKYMNVGSDAQLRTLLFGGIHNRKNRNKSLPSRRKFKVPNIDNFIEDGKKTPKKYRDITLYKITSDLQTDFYTLCGWPSVSGDALKAIAGTASTEYDFSTDASEDPLIDDSLDSERKDVDISSYGTAFGGGQEGTEACDAIASLCEFCSINSLISNFILPLQGSHVSGRNGRIHCSLNINTETGRLSARRPNLQNQPALEKDRYKIRQAFVAAPGNSLIVADYGQLELRILAHLADCKSMKKAFEDGGDFHSRTAMNMYPYIFEAVERKEVILEWHPQPGEEKPLVPLLKDAFGSERRKAKMLNFSIAYGKTPQGLAKDWKVSVIKARETVDLWYKERQEVLSWQKAQKKEAEKSGCVHTLLGRARRFPSMARASLPQRSHIERAAINTPVQGSAADVTMCAMLEIDRNNRLKELGWKLVSQVHDEVILEGPSESAEAAKAIVVECMSKPFNGKNILSVELVVDAKCAQNWYVAK